MKTCREKDKDRTVGTKLEWFMRKLLDQAQEQGKDVNQAEALALFEEKGFYHPVKNLLFDA